MKTKTTRTERFEICTLCGGRGQESTFGQGHLTATSATTMNCRQCGGSGRKLVEVTHTTETIE